MIIFQEVIEEIKFLTELTVSFQESQIQIFELGNSK